MGARVLQRARAAYRAGDARACRAHIDRGLADAAPGSSEEAQLRAVEARLLLWERPAPAEARHALRLAVRSGAPTWEAEVALGTALAVEGRRSAVTHIDRALASARTAAERAETHLLAGVALHDLGRLREARTRFETVARTTRRADLVALGRYGAAHAAMMVDADYGYAIAQLQAARRGELGLLADEARAALALAWSDQGEDERAAAVLDEHEGLPVAWNRATLLSARAEAEWAARRLERCIAVAEECAAVGYPVVAELALHTRAWAQLERGIEPEVPEMSHPSAPLLAYMRDDAEGLRALAAGRPEEARAAFLRSARKLRRIFVRNELRALLGAAYATEAMGDAAGARRQRRAIEQRARELGIAAICRRLEAPLAPSARAELTPRRRQVVELVAAGLSSREIADRLSISRATVESHVRAVLAQTGARTRVEAASRLQPSTAGPRLEPDEQRIVGLLATGATVSEAALLLHMSRRTLTRRLARIRDRVGAETNASLVSRRAVSD